MSLNYTAMKTAKERKAKIVAEGLWSYLVKPSLSDVGWNFHLKGGKIRIYKERGRKPHLILHSPYLDTELPAVSFTAYFDRLVISHPAHPMRILSKDSGFWTLKAQTSALSMLATLGPRGGRLTIPARKRV